MRKVLGNPQGIPHPLPPLPFWERGDPVHGHTVHTHSNGIGVDGSPPSPARRRGAGGEGQQAYTTLRTPFFE
jgi:hypothetical protein